MGGSDPEEEKPIELPPDFVEKINKIVLENPSDISAYDLTPKVSVRLVGAMGEKLFDWMAKEKVPVKDFVKLVFKEVKKIKKEE